MASFISEPQYGAMRRDFQSFAGPGDKDLPMSEVSGYQPVSRIGEIVMNAFVDSYEFAGISDQLTAQDMSSAPPPRLPSSTTAPLTSR